MHNFPSGHVEKGKALTVFGAPGELPFLTSLLAACMHLPEREEERFSGEPVLSLFRLTSLQRRDGELFPPHL